MIPTARQAGHAEGSVSEEAGSSGVKPEIVEAGLEALREWEDGRSDPGLQLPLTEREARALVVRLAKAMIFHRA
jgi:hypothetical protein